MVADRSRIVRYCLAVLGASWILIGFLRNFSTGITIRHFIQASPLLLATIVFPNRQSWILPIGVPLFLEWLAGMFILWNSWRWRLQTTTHFVVPMQEVVLGGIITLSALLGLVFAGRIASDLRFRKRVVLFVTALAVQFIAMFLGTLAA
jgi:hypothetical protein